MTRLICKEGQIGLFFCPAGKIKQKGCTEKEFAELLILAIGLSMDAFAISICKGLSVEKLEKKHMVITGLWFGGSQMAMPIIGYFVGRKLLRGHPERRSLAVVRAGCCSSA